MTGTVWPQDIAFAHVIDGLALNAPVQDDDVRVVPTNPPPFSLSHFPPTRWLTRMLKSGGSFGWWPALIPVGLFCLWFIPTSTFLIYRFCNRHRVAGVDERRRKMHRPASPDVYEDVTVSSAISSNESAALRLENWRHALQSESSGNPRSP